ncbi:hypothetical protein CK203_019484 [Vitis vinifera]|uniref:Uncharacterized protein n=1 Tax=Vitis vinifera TaxID=29760 RepID=A0A438IZ25_VITVI|nr:hypothetical protein CK203_019484 [Vitis vinifera]
MDPLAVTVDQFTATMASVQEVIDSLNQKPDSQQVQITILEDTHVCMDRIEQYIRQLRVSDDSTA